MPAIHPNGGEKALQFASMRCHLCSAFDLEVDYHQPSGRQLTFETGDLAALLHLGHSAPKSGLCPTTIRFLTFLEVSRITLRRVSGECYSAALGPADNVSLEIQLGQVPGFPHGRQSPHSVSSRQVEPPFWYSRTTIGRPRKACEQANWAGSGKGGTGTDQALVFDRQPHPGNLVPGRLDFKRDIVCWSRAGAMTLL